MDKLKALLKQYEAAVNFRSSYLMKYSMGFTAFMLSPRKYGRANGEFYAMLKLGILISRIILELIGIQSKYINLRYNFVSGEISANTFIRELDILLGYNYEETKTG